MASVKKRGDSYRIFVSNGYRCDGSKIVETMTYTPEPGMTENPEGCLKLPYIKTAAW